MISVKEEPFSSGAENVTQIFFFLQETHFTIATEKQWKNEWGAETITCHGGSNSRGVAILRKNGVDCTIYRKILDPLGRYIILKAQIQEKIYVLINVYAPNKDKELVKFFDSLLYPLSATHRIYRSLTTGNPKIRKIFALHSIDVKLSHVIV